MQHRLLKLHKTNLNLHQRKTFYIGKILQNPKLKSINYLIDEKICITYTKKDIDV